MTDPERPRRRSDLTIVRRQVDDETFYVVADPRTNEYVRFGEVEYAIFDLLDGTRGLPEIATDFEARTGSAIVPADLAEFIDVLRTQGLIEEASFDPEVILAEFRARERAELTRRRFVSGSLALLRFAPFNPDRILGRLARSLSWCWSRSATVACVVLMAAACALTAAAWDRFSVSFRAFVAQTVSAGAGVVAARLLLFYVVVGVIIIVHEAAHGLTLKHYGGTVPEMGFALAYFQIPGAYTDTTGSYLLPGRFERVMVSLAGGYTGLVAAALAVFVWWVTEPGQTLNMIALMIIMIGGPVTLLFNWNPLVPYDGYYMATDILETPNLLPRSFAYLGDCIRTRIFGVRSSSAPPPVRLRRIFVVYGTLAWTYQAMWAIAVPFGAYVLFSRVAGEWIGAVLAGFVTIGFARSPLETLARFLQSVRAERSGAGRVGGSKQRTAAVAIVALSAVAVFTPACPLHVHARVALAAAERAEVRATVSGFVAEILAQEGEDVEANDPLVRLEAPDLSARLEAVRVERERARAVLAQEEARGAAGAPSARAELERLLKDEALLMGRAAHLVLAAPRDGKVIGTRLVDRLGTHLAEGALWCEVASADPLRLIIEVEEADLADVQEGDAVVAIHEGHPGRWFHGSVVRVPREGRLRHVMTAGKAAAGDPSLSRAAYSIEAVLSGERTLIPGMTVEARIEGRRMSLASRAGRAILRIFRGKIWW